MLYPENFELKIGFDQIRLLLKKHCAGDLGGEKVDDMSFLTDYDAVVEQLDRGAEFLRILQGEQNFPEVTYLDIRPSLSRLRIEGTWLDEAELFDLKRSLDSMLRVVQFFMSDDPDQNPYPRLSELAKHTAVYPDVVKNIDRILSKFGKILDSASPNLAEIRKELFRTSSGLSKRMATILRQAQQDGLVEKDATPGIREGRLVIPISPMYKRKLRGIVHDESASGKTVFIEPEELVEANNRIRELENEERREIIRILTVFADSVRPYAVEMTQSFQLLAEIDFARAKAKLALELNAIRPILEREPGLDWSKARHPLLMLSLRKQQKEVVPLSLTLDNKYRILIISGPNAGGKSVCLKTVGLLQYMVQCGLMIPLHDSSHVGLFERLFIDIGDEQSIENDLSTYSSHLLNMKHFLRNSTEKSLLLIDEFGSGTEPKIGGAIAQACLDRFNKSGALGIITTHYGNLKHFADEHEGLMNGAMLYDRHEMRPLFMLETGHPGSSFAVEIARKIGLPEDVIAEASELVGSEYIDMDKFLQDIVRDKRYWENKRQSIRIQEKKLNELTAQYESEVATVGKKQKEIIAEAKAEALRLIQASNATIENTIRGIRQSQAEKEQTKLLRKELKDFEETVKPEKPKVQPKPSKSVHSNVGEGKKPEVGSTVKLKGQEAVGTIMEIKGKKAVVAFGMIKSTVELSKLEHGKLKKISIENPYTTLGKRSSDEIREKKLRFKQDLDVRGQRGDEALQTVMYFLDDAIMTGVGRVRILHGTGTGVLRQLIRQYLATVPGVSHYADEHIQFGGAGITVVDLE